MSSKAPVSMTLRSPLRWPRLFLAGLIRLYQIGVSPLLGSRCRFYPSCSQYARDSIIKHGVVRGFFYSAARIVRCHPWNPGGYDPVK